MSNELKPVAYQARRKDNRDGSLTYGEWQEWANKTEDQYNDVRGLIDAGYPYETRELYAIPEGYHIVAIGSEQEQRDNLERHNEKVRGDHENV